MMKNKRLFGILAVGAALIVGVAATGDKMLSLMVNSSGECAQNVNFTGTITVNGAPISGGVTSVFGKTGVVADISDAAGFLYNNGSGTFSYSSPAGGGDVVGPASATDNAITRFNSTTGKLVQNSLATVDDNGTINIPSGQSYKINGTALAAADVGAAPSAQGVTNGNSHDHSGGDGAAIVAAATSFSATDKLLGRATAGAGAGEEIACTAAGRALLDDATATDQRNTLGLGTAALGTTGTGSGNVPTRSADKTLDADTIAEITAAAGVTIDGVKAKDSFLELSEVAAPASPAADKLRVYAKDDSGTTKLCVKDSAGTETILGAGGGGSMVYPGAGVAVSTGSAWGTSLTAPSGAIVGTTDSQALTNKSVNGVTPTAAETGFTVAGGTTSKTLTVTGDATISGTPGDTIAPATNSANYVPQWNGANSKTLSNGLAVGTAASNLVQLDGSAKLPAVDGSALTALSAANMANLDFVGGRLSLASGTPVMTADSTSSATLYYALYKNNLITLYSGSAWQTITFAETSLSLSALNGVYDIFGYNNSGTFALEALAWTNATTRATALAYQDGRLVKSGAATRRYLGTINVSSGTSYAVLYSSAVGGTANCKLDVWNYYNRVPVRLWRKDTTNPWTYNSSTIRQANGVTGNQCNFVIGLSEDPITANLQAVSKTDNASYYVDQGVSLDSITTFTTGASAHFLHYGTSTTLTNISYKNYVAIGSHYIAWLEREGAGGTGTYYGGEGPCLTVELFY